MPGGPREWITAASTTNVPVGSRLRIVDPCLTPVSGAAIRPTSFAAAFPSTSRFLVTQNWNPKGQGGTYNPHPVRVELDGTDFWIVNEDGAAMPSTAAFNVALDTLATVATPPDRTAKVLVIPNATSPSTTYLLTHFVDLSSQKPVPLTAEPFVRYINGNWQIESTAGFFQPNVTFNVSTRGTSSFLVRAPIFDYAYIVPPITDPNAYVFVTQNVTPPNDKPATTTDKVPVGVWYDGSKGQWAVFNEDGSAMQVGVGFSVWNPT
jgi:hypothetical protein